VTIKNYKVINCRPTSTTFNNTDGVDFDECTNGNLYNAFLYCGDDNMAVKNEEDSYNGSSTKNTRNIVHEKIVTYSNSVGCKIGTKTKGQTMQDVIFRDIDIVKAGRALCIDAYDTAVVSNTRFENIRVEKADSILIDVREDQPPDWRTCANQSIIRDTYFTDLSSDQKKVINLHGKDTTYNIDGVHFNNFTVQGNPVTSSNDPDASWSINSYVYNITFDTSSTPTPAPTPDQTPGPTPIPNQEPIWSGGPYTLNGTSDYVDLPDGLTGDLYDFSIACWVKLNTLDTWSRIYDFGGDSNIFMMLTPASGNTGYPYFCITTSGNDGEQGINGTSALPTGSWQHIAVTRSGNTGILYINTQEVGRNTGMTLNPADLGNTTNNYIGRSQWDHDPYLNASIENFVVYNRALSASEVSALGSTPPGGGTGALGDANGDGAINIVDALLIAQYYVGLNPSGFIEGNADTNCDGTINIVDALLVAQLYVGLIAGFC
jgi:hypothetical protein